MIDTHQIVNKTIEIAQHHGYVGLALAMLVQGLIQIVPAYLIMPPAGYLAAQGKLDLGLVIISGFSGGYIACIALYEIGRWMNRLTFTDESLIKGRYLRFCIRTYKRSQEWFDRYGTQAVFWCRFVPLLRTMISVVAGIELMSRRKYLIFTAAGTFLYVALLAVGGYELEGGWRLIGEYQKPIRRVLIPLGIAAFFWWLSIYAAERFVRASTDGNSER